MSGQDDINSARQDHRTPHSARNPIPTIQHYKEVKQERQANAFGDGRDVEDAEPSRTEQAKEAYKDWRGGKYDGHQDGQHHLYQSGNLNIHGAENELEQYSDRGHNRQDHEQHDRSHEDKSNEQEEDEGSDYMKDTTQEGAGQNPKQQRKAMKKRKDESAEREVTDPVTHLPVTIHDFTKTDLEDAPENGPPPGSHHRTATGLSGASKSDENLDSETAEQREVHTGMERLFPPPDFDETRKALVYVYKKATAIGLGCVLMVMVCLLLVEKAFGLASSLESTLFRHASTGKIVSSILLLVISASLGSVIIWGLQGYVERRVRHVWESQVWEAERQQGKGLSKAQTPESAQWLNSLLGSVWPIVNPDLFTSLADTLEDVMQASLPRMVRMVSVDDLGQGAESIRILGVKWLPTGAAAKSVTESGDLKSEDKNPNKSDRSVPGQGEVDDSTEDKKDGNSGDKNERREESESQQNVAEGMEAEEGDFINMEIAFAYRARGDGRSLKHRSKNAHLYLAFYLPGNIKLPVWVELHGFVGVMRVRLQLTPDPPFFSLCTLTFLGQPKVDVSCVPLTKRGLDLMDLPLISNFVSSSVDAAVASYVAPKSLTLDLKDMLMGDDFKKDTTARGVLMIHIKRAFDFKEGDTGLLGLKDGSADPYVTVGWAKFGKPVWSTRVILSEMEPYWDEYAFVLVTPEELNVDENIRVQLWDSDRTTADDDLGRIEIPLKDLMRDLHSNGNMWDRTDGFKALKAGEGMPGRLDWSVGYFSKTRILDSQLAQQSADPDIKNFKQLKQKVHEESERKLREAKKDESVEIEQQKAQDMKARSDELLITSPPPQEYPSGILSVQLHQAVGLELEVINKNRNSKNEDASDEEEEGDDLPSSYCNIIINHQKVYRTRTKPKNGKPFFNAGCERFIRDWRNTDLHIAVRDARVHEDDPLLGVVYLPLGKIFEKRAQVNGFFPLAGGVGYGKVRLSLVFRSIHLQAPRQLLGWEYGTLEIDPIIRPIEVPESLRKLRLKVHTTLGRRKFHHNNDGWSTKKNQPARLAVRKRYNNPLIFEFRKDSALRDKTPAYGVLWLKDVKDAEDETHTVSVYTGDFKRATTCTLPEGGEKVGSFEVRLKFWPGLSVYHSKLARKDQNLADVMEVLDTADDADEGDSDGSGSGSSTSSDDSEDEEVKSPRSLRSMLSSKSKTSLAENGKRGPVDQVKDYMAHKDQMHSKHRGMMQWKGPRTVKWMKTKLQHGEQKVESLFKHHERETAVETEV